MSKKLYAGIGSRDIDPESMRFLEDIAVLMANKGYVLRSGGASGSDSAFEEGALWDKEIFTADDCTLQAEEIASQFHPAWHNCKEYVRKLHGRNAMIILGEDLNTPVERVFCWTLNENRGGTSLGLKIARHYKIPVHNLANPETAKKFKELL